MNVLKHLFWVACAFVLCACASDPTKLNIMQINGLSSAASDTGSFNGLEAQANPVPGGDHKRVNVFYLHGIGWTEDPDSDPLASNFINGIAKSYDLTIEGNILSSQCGTKGGIVDRVARSIDITTGAAPIFYQTIIPGARLKLDKLVCMDRQTIKVDEELEYVIYRVFWDEIFWNSLQSAHVGQDHHLGPATGVAGLRRKYNRRLKDEMVNYGFSDAVMYLGPAGEEIRKAVKGAMCAAALDAAGQTFEKQGESISGDEACTQATDNLEITNQFAFVSESLGSKISFDVMREVLTDDRSTILDEMISGSEIYMLANQIALLSLSDLTHSPVKKAQLDPRQRRPRIVALSEINDFLSYEISPFFENLWNRQYLEDGQVLPEFDSSAREVLSQTLGFDFVDVRLEFADPIVGLINDFVDPLQAHSEHSGEPRVMQLLICGAQNGKVHYADCGTAPISRIIN